MLPLEELAAIGYSLVLYPLSGLYAATKALENVYRDLFANGTTSNRKAMADFSGLNEIIGLERHFPLSDRYSSEWTHEAAEPTL